MKLILILLVALTVANAAWDGGLRGRFGLNFLKSFFEIPRTVSAAIEEGWTLRTRSADLPYQTLTMYCPSPATVCTLYDDTEYVAGLQIAFDETRVEPAYDLAINGFTKWTTDDGTYWAITEYFASEEFYALESSTRLGSRNAKTMLQTDSIWVTGTNGKLYRVPRNIQEIEQTDFVRHACVPAMGLHYYYNLTKQMECTAAGIFPFAAMYDDGELVGTAFTLFGSYSETGDRKWLDMKTYPARLALKVLIHNDGPDCLYDLQESPGSLNFHSYFVDKPGMITCADHLTNLG